MLAKGDLSHTIHTHRHRKKVDIEVMQPQAKEHQKMSAATRSCKKQGMVSSTEA